MLLKRLAGLIAIVFGVVGVAACVAGAFGVWRAQARLDSANDKVFDAVDSGLVAVEDRVPIVQQRVSQAKITTDEINDRFRDWATRTAAQRLAAQVEIDRRTDILSGHMQAIDVRLDASLQAMNDVRRILDLSQSLGANVDPASTDRVLELLTELRRMVQDANEAVDDVRKFATPDGAESLESRLARTAKLLARILLTISEIDRRLADFAVRFAELRVESRQLQLRTSDYILLGAIIGSAILAWIAIGQVALCRWGWQSCCRSCSAVGGSPKVNPT